MPQCWLAPACAAALVPALCTAFHAVQAYADAETSIDNNGTIKGIAFWRWAAINTPGEDLATFDNAATICASFHVLGFTFRVGCSGSPHR